MLPLKGTVFLLCVVATVTFAACSLYVYFSIVSVLSLKIMIVSDVLFLYNLIVCILMFLIINDIKRNSSLCQLSARKVLMMFDEPIYQVQNMVPSGDLGQLW